MCVYKIEENRDNPQHKRFVREVELDSREIYR